MKKIKKSGAQGDLLIRKMARSEVPKAAARVELDGGKVVVAHSETGHHHYLDPNGVTLLREPSNPMIAYLVIAGAYADVVHARPHDTHETIRLPRGTYELRRQREHTPEGWRRVED